jgi:hypothetical protein
MGDKMTDEEHNRKMDILSQIEAIYPDSFKHSYFEAYEMFESIEDFNKVYHTLPLKLIYKYVSNSVEPLGEINLVGEVTLLDLWVAADQLIAKANYYHQCFITKFVEISDNVFELYTIS